MSFFDDIKNFFPVNSLEEERENLVEKMRKESLAQLYKANINKIERFISGDKTVSEFEIGRMLFEGQPGVEKSKEAGLKYITISANNGEYHALTYLGEIYRNEYNYPMAISTYKKAALFNHDVLIDVEILAGYIKDFPDGKTKDSDIPWDIIKSTCNNHKMDKFLQLCESEPERKLLEALITIAKLKPCEKTLEGDISVRPQAKILNYRADFLINNFLIIEVDGKKYHNNTRSFDRDRERDQTLMLNGYKTIRFSANQIYTDSQDAAKKITLLGQGRGTEYVSPQDRLKGKFSPY